MGIRATGIRGNQLTLKHTSILNMNGGRKWAWESSMLVLDEVRKCLLLGDGGLRQHLEPKSPPSLSLSL